MIVLTGPGRGGTSLLAGLYRELGFDPGGSWSDDFNGGYEDVEVVALNQQILAGLGFRVLGSRGDVPAPVRLTLKPFLPAPVRRRLREAVRRRRPQAALDHITWSAVPAIVDSLGERLTVVAGTRDVVKDPRFCLTLPVWLTAGAAVEHVVASVRPSRESARSREASGWSGFENGDLLRTAAVLEIGCLYDALVTYGLPHTLLRFPDWAEDPERLAAELPFPQPVPAGAVAAALERLHRPELVHYRA